MGKQLWALPFEASTSYSESLSMSRYFLRKLKKVKKSHGQVLAINEVTRISSVAKLVCPCFGEEHVLAWRFWKRI